MESGTPLFLFLDESGNFDFSANGTRYFVLTAVAKRRPFPLVAAMEDLRYALIEEGRSFDFFHASNNPGPIRERTFGVLNKNQDGLDVYAAILEKALMPAELRLPEQLYALGIRLLLGKIPTNDLNCSSQLIIITDNISGKHGPLLRAIKKQLSEFLQGRVPYQLRHHRSMAHVPLQVADYMSWAIFRKWEMGDLRAYKTICLALRCEIAAQFPGAEKK